MLQLNSYAFIFEFMPVVVLAYFLCNRIDFRIGKAIIIIASVCLYASYGSDSIIILGASIVLNLIFVLIGSKTCVGKIYLVFPLIINIGLLVYFKYTNFIIENLNSAFSRNVELRNLMLPVGISFFTFQQIAYLVAVFRGDIHKVDVVDYVTYILYFPKLLMGPLMDPVDFIEQINNDKLKKINWDNIACGIKIFSFGLFKKVFIADTMARGVSWGFDVLGAASSFDWIIVMLCYTLEIYFDFSGYSDMAVGTSLMLNILLPINFDSPYKAISIRDFWKRWHISLTKFFTKYIYIPLGGSRRGEFFTAVNTMIVFLISGIWHGANWTFILWGLLHGVFSIVDRVIEKLKLKIFEPFRWLMTFGIVNILWLLFRAEDIGQWKYLLHLMFSMENTSISDGIISALSIPEMQFLSDKNPLIESISMQSRGLFMSIFLLVSIGICFLTENTYKDAKKLTFGGMILAAIAFLAGVACLGTESVFVYYNF